MPIYLPVWLFFPLDEKYPRMGEGRGRGRLQCIIRDACDMQ
jgi:hypothetical protein